jgi:hypothetical protein
LSLLVIQTIPDKLADASIVARIRILQVAAHPRFDITYLGERITHNLAAGIELCKADTER